MANKLIILFNDTNDISSHIDPSLGVFRQGDVGHEIYCHFENFANYSYGAYIMFERADGSKSPELPMTLADFTYSGTLYSGFKLVIDDEWIMAQDGALKATVRVRNASGTVVASGLVPISLEKTVYDESPNITVEQYNALVAMLEGFITDDSILYPHVLSSVPEDLTDILVNSVLFVIKDSGDLEVYKVVASGEDKVLSDAFVIDSSLIKETFSPTNYTPTTSTPKGHFVGIDNELDDIITGVQLVGKAKLDEGGNDIRASYGASLYTDDDDVALKITLRNKLNAVLTTLILREATTTKNGLMSATDKVKLEALPTNADLTNALNGKADKATTLSGYGITDAYTKTEADNLLDDKADLVEGKVPSSQLPSYVDDVLEYDNLAAFPETGESDKIYIAIDTNKTYRWSGSAYVEISASVALGETSSTAYRGDRGKTAYDHSQVVSGNPHQVTKTDVGLGNVDNTSDLNKPISTPQQTAINEVLKFISTGVMINLFDKTFGANGTYINASDGQLYTSSGSAFRATDYLLLEAGKTYYFYGFYANGLFAFYNTSKVFISSGYDATLTKIGDYKGTITVGSSNLYIRMSCEFSTYLNNAYFSQLNKFTSYGKTDYSLTSSYLKQNISLSNKKVLVIGDSISTDIYASYKKWVSDLIDDGTFISSLVTNNSVHATGFVAKYGSDSTTTFLSRIQAVTNKNTYDLVIIFGGINDFLQNIPLGTESDSPLTHFIPAVNWLFNYLVTNFTQARICVLRPLKVETNSANTQGKYVEDYSNAINTGAKKFCLPVLNLTEESGFSPFIPAFRDMWTNTNYTGSDGITGDGVHPNLNYGKKYLAPMIKNFLKNLIGD